MNKLRPTNAEFKSLWDVSTYELISRNNVVRCVQVTLVGTRWRFNFDIKLDFFKLYIYKMMNKECASLLFLFLFNL